ncbi:matrix remodeling-associated protein 8b [Electrophorus electricus]|uniref:Matrix remodeling-associated protein 8 n=1 Tax=Electrophorus electricus TaxID=8005 RepID=A0A4W4HJ01_ELEEL|nr:matrix remodeling-associated protein 8b [Electrophorus electricus]
MRSVRKSELHHLLTNIEMRSWTRSVSEMFLVLCIAVSLFTPHLWAQSSGQSVLVEARNITVQAGSKAILPCQNQRIVWRQDHLRDRQRVVHWDLNRNRPDYTTERILDMYSGGTERVYNAYNKGRVTLSKDAFTVGNFSLIIHNVDVNDKGVYTCNLHHHYCKIHQSIQIQLNVTKSSRKERRVWDGEKSVFVVLVGSSVVLPCVNRRPLWRAELQGEDQQQVVHWDFQAPGVSRDQADRLIDLYASGEKREYGPLFLPSKMNVSAAAFSVGDFSLTVADMQPSNKGLYSCHLHHQYCGLRERRVFRVIVEPAVPAPPPATPMTEAPPADPGPSQWPEHLGDELGTNMVESPHVLNVILPESRTHLLHRVGYILAICLMLLLMFIGILVTTRQCKNKALDYDLRKSARSQVTEFESQATESNNPNNPCSQSELRLDYKNNITKERVDMNNYPAPKVVDLNQEMEKLARK